MTSDLEQQEKEAKNKADGLKEINEILQRRKLGLYAVVEAAIGQDGITRHAGRVVLAALPKDAK